MTKYKTTHLEDYTRIERDNYHLIILAKEPIDWVSISFDVLNYKGNPEMMISGRDLHQYTSEIRNIEINPQQSYVEIGAGMGEFIHAAARQNPLQKPIVIDPINYLLMWEMLEYAKIFAIREPVLKRLSLYQERCRDILNPHKIRLLNCKLDRALAIYPEIRESADVVVDHYAAHYYTPVQRKSEIENIERQLLKPTGRLLH
ncbi:MAG TPA: class I SAM-dependent methyltransferase [Candidatus Nanoarchaeia archaeon]|nr:class I SAM-dependent methyltransferase [Candidatus Nanoarchaeia archaeon]